MLLTSIILIIILIVLVAIYFAMKSGKKKEIMKTGETEIVEKEEKSSHPFEVPEKKEEEFQKTEEVGNIPPEETTEKTENIPSEEPFKESEEEGRKEEKPDIN